MERTESEGNPQINTDGLKLSVNCAYLCHLWIVFLLLSVCSVVRLFSQSEARREPRPPGPLNR
jgi:hypothetical protein